MSGIDGLLFVHFANCLYKQMKRQYNEFNYNILRGAIMIYYYDYETKIGKIRLSENGTAITGFLFENSPLLVADRWESVTKSETPLLKDASLQINDYLSGNRTRFNLPLQPNGTDFQKAVWNALCAIPFGETRSYKQIAEAVGNENASRAVGLACNRNPIAIIIPCHRVISTSGKLTGYAGGLSVKERLLNLEKSGDIDESQK